MQVDREIDIDITLTLEDIERLLKGSILFNRGIRISTNIPGNRYELQQIHRKHFTDPLTTQMIEDYYNK